MKAFIALFTVACLFAGLYLVSEAADRMSARWAWAGLTVLALAYSLDSILARFA